MAKRFTVERFDKYEAVMYDNDKMITEEKAVELLNNMNNEQKEIDKLKEENELLKEYRMMVHTIVKAEYQGYVNGDFYMLNNLRFIAFAKKLGIKL